MLEDQNEELKRKLKNAHRWLPWYEAKKRCNAPSSKSDRLLNGYGIQPDRIPEIRKKIYGECLNEEIKIANESQAKSCRKVQVVHRVLSGRVMKKYRMKSTMETRTNLNRRNDGPAKVSLQIRNQNLMKTEKNHQCNCGVS